MGLLDIAQRACAVLLRALKYPYNEIEDITKIKRSTVQKICRKARERGLVYWVDQPIIILDRYLIDAPRSGRAPKGTSEFAKRVVNAVVDNRNGREKSSHALAEYFGVSPRTIWRILKAYGFRKSKPTRKPGLTDKQRYQRYLFAIRYKDWTYEDWKRVIWTDETSVMLGVRRGGYRLWRRAKEKEHKTCIRPRWKRNSEFMFWGSFTADLKGPCHIFKPETQKDKEMAHKQMEEWNEWLEPRARVEWDLSLLHRIGLRGIRGKKPSFKWSKESGKFERNSTDSIDWW